MKKYSIIVLAAVAVLAAVSCEKEKEKESTGFPAGLVDTLTPVDTIVPPDTLSSGTMRYIILLTPTT